MHYFWEVTIHSDGNEIFQCGSKSSLQPKATNSLNKPLFTLKLFVIYFSKLEAGWLPDNTLKEQLRLYSCRHWP